MPDRELAGGLVVLHGLLVVHDVPGAGLLSVTGPQQRVSLHSEIHAMELTEMEYCVAWDSEMMLAVTTGGDMCTFSLVPTSNLMVALNRVFVFNT